MTQKYLYKWLCRKTGSRSVTVTYNNVKTEIEKFNRLVNLSNNVLKFQMGMDQQLVFEPIETIDPDA